MDYHKELIDNVDKAGFVELGYHSSWSWLNDPKRLGFILARYKFVAKMLEGKNKVLEIGCADGFYSRVVAQTVGHLLAVDKDLNFIQSAITNRRDYNIEFRKHDMVKGPISGEYFDAFYTIDVIEHIDPKEEEAFLDNAFYGLHDDGVAVVACPSLESQVYASKFSKMGHVNLKTQDQLRDTMKRYFKNVFMFSMNDEVLHTGFAGMSQYNFALCAGPT